MTLRSHTVELSQVLEACKGLRELQFEGRLRPHLTIQHPNLSSFIFANHTVTRLDISAPNLCHFEKQSMGKSLEHFCLESNAINYLNIMIIPHCNSFALRSPYMKHLKSRNKPEVIYIFFAHFNQIRIYMK